MRWEACGQEAFALGTDKVEDGGGYNAASGNVPAHLTGTARHIGGAEDSWVGRLEAGLGIRAAVRVRIEAWGGARVARHDADLGEWAAHLARTTG